MEEKSTVSVRVDLSSATEDELQSIKSEVLKRLAERVKDPIGLRNAYDRHGSGHSRS